METIYVRVYGALSRHYRGNAYEYYDTPDVQFSIEPVGKCIVVTAAG